MPLVSTLLNQQCAQIPSFRTACPGDQPGAFRSLAPSPGRCAFPVRSGQHRCRSQPSTVCMAEPRRVARVNKQLEREIGSLLLYDKVLQKAVCPEKRRGMDTAESAIASVTEVRITSDLQVAKVYISIFSDPRGKEVAMEQLARLQPYVRKKIGDSMSLRLTPEIRFVYDEAHERGERVLKLLKQIKMQESGEMEAPPITMPAMRIDNATSQTELDEILRRHMDNAETGGAKNESEPDASDEEEEGFFDGEKESSPQSAASGPQSAFRAGRRQDLSMSSPEPPPDTSFFGFEDPGGAYDHNEEVVWQEDDEIEDAAGVANWVGGSRAEGGSEALESANSRNSANASKKRT